MDKPVNYNYIDQFTVKELKAIITNYVKVNSLRLTGKKLNEVNNEDVKFSSTINSQQSRTVFASIENLGISIVLTDYFASLTYGNSELDSKFENYWLVCLIKKFPYEYVDAYKDHYLDKYSSEFEQKRNALFEKCDKLMIISRHVREEERNNEN